MATQQGKGSAGVRLARSWPIAPLAWLARGVAVLAAATVPSQ
jgi:hypothetical protein